MRPNAPLRERVAKLGPHERARRKTSDPVEIAIASLFHSVEIRVLNVAIELETVVVHDSIDLVAKRLDDRSDFLHTSLDDRLRLDRQLREIEEQRIVRIVEAEARVER